MVESDFSTEGSEPAKVGTDEQEVHKRLIKMDEQTHHCDVQRIQKKILIGRCNRNQQKEHALTGGGLQCYELAMKKSADLCAEVIYRSHEHVNVYTKAWVIVLIDTSCVKIN